ncbi:MAG: carbamoyltransferase HypF [Methylococcaceae bacterium]|nr:carbamoyltransferase HypF [Methylococcaceae bacterium]MDP2394431.1 carbamoyltransferase HypF [Methylococcaceae bacterium]MDP3021474.1 carbamoyltransferase HypF [Methylococcaceae bacterium]MDP3390407.1 carbamoyltransferase HypF [Methylococcaceae bacterium]MDP3934567.1 carbamoyltransferase HypF [Methylococcaceae bacterium]
MTLEGVIQGIGMRPFIARLARQTGQSGWVANTANGLSIAIEGNADMQQQFLYRLNNDAPRLAIIASQTISLQPLAHFSDFQIKDSAIDGSKSAFVLPDLAICTDCVSDMFKPQSRFYRYPFTSCSQCGPRYSIMVNQPYDRERTTMAGFKYCADCEHEYQAVDNRRFHAQTIACPNCGPALQLLDHEGNTLAENDLLLATGDYLRAGKILAVKGIGGFQLLVDATNQDAIERLRIRKHRPQKPFALMVADLAAAQALCYINDSEQQALSSYAAPIVLLKRRNGTPIADSVAPESDLLGVMLACSPLHHLLLHDVGAPLVATSGNRHNEPICIDNDQALEQLAGIADYFLMHNRPILRPLDDSIVRLIGDNITVLRRARGYVPTPITLKSALPDMLAVGGQLKNTVAVSHGNQILLSQHLGDLDSAATKCQFDATITDLQEFYQIKPVKIMRDLHSDYASSQSAERLAHSANPPLNTATVQHHYAHILSCMAEHNLEPPLLGIAWDGSGLGSDNTLWGGEFLRLHAKGFQRYAHFRPFALPGGYKAIQEPRRAALGMLYEILADRAFDRNGLGFSEPELQLLRSALSKHINCPTTTSVGRLFDAVASLLGLCQINHYEGQAAMALENCATQASQSNAFYDFQISEAEPLIIDWQPMLEQLLDDIINPALVITDNPFGLSTSALFRTGFSKPHKTSPSTSSGRTVFNDRINQALIADKFHNTLTEIILAVAVRAGEQTIVLSGGCFQNALLVEKILSRLKTAGFTVYCHEKIPPNDGGLALGQLYATKYTG